MATDDCDEQEERAKEDREEQRLEKGLEGDAKASKLPSSPPALKKITFLFFASTANGLPLVTASILPKPVFLRLSMSAARQSIVEPQDFGGGGPWR